ncbi:MAG TPA: RNA polymerase sigma factor [Pirellulales bacterium]|nr:RNA polymerase sigma factor [Pirellulales bacterium]
MHDSDVQLMRRANLGDRAAFAEIVRRYQGALRRVAESRLGTVEAAEDVVQETFFAAYKSRHSYDERFGFRTWLWTILLNQCRRYAGRQARHARTISIDRGEPSESSQRRCEPTAPADAALAGLMAHERREVLERLLLRLSAVQADALRLRFFGGLKFQEIADTMQCSLCTAKNRVRWGLLKLSELVHEEAAASEPSDGRRQSGSSMLPPHELTPDGLRLDRRPDSSDSMNS